MAVHLNLNSTAINAEIMRRGGNVDRNVRARAQRVERRARQLAPRKTGALQASIHAARNRKETGRFDFGYTISADSPHAGYVHDGTAAHLVHVNRKRVLSDPLDNTFGKFALIPAIKGRPFLEQALSAAWKD